MTKLTDTQLLILSKAAQRDDHAVEPPSTPKGATAQKVVRKLIKDGLVAEAAGGPDLPVWRREEDGRPVSLVITAAGLDAIGIAPEDREEGNEPETPPIARDADDSSGDSGNVPDEPDQPAKTPRAGTKLTAVVQLLEREGGASISDLTAATGWLPHTARAALTGLRKRGYRIETARGEDRKSIYRIIGSATFDEREDHADLAGDGEA